ncbi:FCD domain-containing protein [Devosia pacifica]|uniref:FCD domain-containing protein n=1 Tax=Devosia pacifica TaxID=1335967 RepID=UPI003570EDAA
MPASVHRALKRTLDQQRAAAAAGETERFDQLDNRFHELLCTAARVSYAWQTLSQMRVHAARVCAMARLPTDALLAVAGEHASILAAIEAHDPARATAEMRAHLSGFTSKLEAALAQHRAYFVA